jgi:hypothetical protein
MEGFLALQQLSSDRLVADPTLTQECSRHCQRLFRIIRGLADAPFIPFAGITGNNFSRLAVESRDSSGVPLLDIGPGQHFCLLTYGITGCQSLETADYAFLKPHRDGEVFQVSHAGGGLPEVLVGVFEVELILQ